jgi:hypothetical protein
MNDLAESRSRRTHPPSRRRRRHHRRRIGHVVVVLGIPLARRGLHPPPDGIHLNFRGRLGPAKDESHRTTKLLDKPKSTFLN